MAAMQKRDNEWHIGMKDDSNSCPKFLAVEPSIEITLCYIDGLARNGQVKEDFTEVKCIIYKSIQEIVVSILCRYRMHPTPVIFANEVLSYVESHEVVFYIDKSTYRQLTEDGATLNLSARLRGERCSQSRSFSCEEEVEPRKGPLYLQCNAAGRSGDAFDLFDFYFNESKIKPDVDACNLIIKSHCEEGRLDDALRLYNHLLRHPPSPNHKTYDLLTKALVDAGMMDQALELLLRGRAELFNVQQPGMYMNLIRGFLQQGNLDMAYQLRDDFKTCSIRNRITVLNSVFVEYLFKQGNDEKAMELYRNSLNNDGFTANGHVGHPYLEVFLKYGKKTQAWALFEYMLDNYDECIGLGDETVNLMLNECIKEGKFSDAVNILAKSKAKLKYFPVGAYRNLITKLCHNARLSEAESVFDEWLKQEFTKPGDATYTSLIHAYIKAERVEDAIETVNQLMAAKLRMVTNMCL
ncbi:hypothetical protein Bca4012_079815 [Brassica carinata]